MTDIAKLADAVSAAIKGYIADRLKAIEASIPETIRRFLADIPRPLDGKDADVALSAAPALAYVRQFCDGVRVPKDGKDADPQAMSDEVARIVSLKLLSIPAPKNGLDGKSVDPESVTRDIERAVAAIPRPKDGIDGKSVDPEFIIREIERAVSAIPKAKDGTSISTESVVLMLRDEVAKLPVPKDGKDADAAAIAADVLARVRESIRQPADGKDADPLLVKYLVESSVAEAAGRIRIPEDGKSVDPLTVRAMVREDVAAAVAAIPVPRDGKDADLALIDAAVARAIAAAPKPDFEAMAKAAALAMPMPKDGAPGRDSDPLVMVAAVALEVKRVTDALPPAPAGKDANPAEIASDVFERVMRMMPKPQDGKSVTVEDIKPLLEGEVSQWALSFERRGADILSRLAERYKGKDGRDGFDLDDIDLSLKDGRTVVLTLKSGDRLVTKRLQLPGLPIDRGVYKSGSAYESGDGVTYGGSWWLALRDTSESPGSEAKDWRLAVKRGRDGKDRETGVAE